MTESGEFGDSVQLGQYVVLSAPREARRLGASLPPARPVRIGERSIVGHHVVLYEGVQIGADCYVDDGCRVGYDSFLGAGTRLDYGAFICDRVHIGAGSVVAGFVGDATHIGNGCIAMGQFVHELSNPRAEWGLEEPAPRLEDGSVVGMGAVVVGGVVIGPRSYVAAGAIVTRDVPPESVVVGVNQVIPASRWNGTRLARDFFE